MEQLLKLYICIPLFAFFISLLMTKKRETIISIVTISALGMHLLTTIAFIAFWIFKGFPTLNIKELTLFNSGNIDIFINFYFDRITAVFALFGSLLAFLVAIFSRYYLHRDEGFKRYFSTILLFFLGYNLVVYSGNFETLFIGWEILGVCSFILIAFYRDRYLPVKNSLKVVSFYRLGDICLILAMWMSHHLWFENITFVKLNDLQLVADHLREHNWYGFFIALMIVIAAAVKSAQFPFSSWLPRAMEGPTSSSAIFYGSLSVHLGVFLLLRTYPYWESILSVKIIIIAIGIATCVVANSIAKVQSSVKTQIAYSSVAQIGLMFIEIAVGFHSLALIHFAGNAFLRTYQLLVSPSVLGYLVQNQLFNFIPRKQKNSDSFLSKIKNTFYLLSIKEWNLDSLPYRFLWSPFKWVGKSVGFLSGKMAAGLLTIVYLLGLSANVWRDKVPTEVFEWLPVAYSIIGLLLILKAFSERGNSIQAWIFVVTGQFFITLSIALLNEGFSYDHILLYLSGSVVSAIVGFICLKRTERIDGDISLNRFHGYSYEQPVTNFVFLIACLGLIGLPFTPTFIGIDVLFSHIHKHENVFIIFTALSFVFIELSILRIYARVYMGQHKKVYHPVAYRSS